MRNLYLVSRYVEDNEYDVYRGAVVCALSEEGARQICIDSLYLLFVLSNSSENISVKYLGKAAQDIELGSVILTDYKAG
jgi:hypothetical protein